MGGQRRPARAGRICGSVPAGPPKQEVSGSVQESDFTMPLPDGGSLAARRQVMRLPSGLSWIEEEMEVRGRLSGAFATGPGWILELHRVTAGVISFVQDG